MLTRLDVENYRVLRQITVPLAPLTVLVGPNGVGKSTTLEALHYLAHLATGGQPTAPPWNEMMPTGSTGSIQDGSVQFRLAKWVPATNQPEVQWVQVMGGQIVGVRKPGTPEWPAGYPMAVIRLRLDPKVLRGDSQGNLPIGQIGPDGSGLAAALNDFKAKDDDRFAIILQAMQQIVPGLRGIKAPRVPQNNQFTISCATTAKSDVPARFMSDGTLYALALVTVLSVHAGQPTLVLLDDIDQGLHPKAQADLITQIRKIQQANPGLQVVATCHSPYLVDSLEGDEVVLMHADAGGFAQAKRLSDHPDYARLKGALGTGEFWGSVGEEWVTSATVPTAGAP